MIVSKHGWVMYLAVILAVIILMVVIIAFLPQDVSMSPSEEEMHVECINNTCTAIEGKGVNECGAAGAFCGCLDTDKTEAHQDGLNQEMKGTVRTEYESQTDICSVFEDILSEYVCESGTLVKKEIDCTAIGLVCQKGRCLTKEEARIECIDSDDGSNYYETGEATQSLKKVQDYCRDETVLGEIICDETENTILVEIVDCASIGNFKCQGGACVPKD